jgi:hypothetical protein
MPGVGDEVDQMMQLKSETKQRSGHHRATGRKRMRPHLTCRWEKNLLGTPRHVGELRVVIKKCQAHHACGAVSVLADEDFGGAAIG